MDGWVDELKVDVNAKSNVQGSRLHIDVSQEKSYMVLQSSLIP